MLPLLAWIAIYAALLIYYVPRIKTRSVASSEARSKLMGRIVDGYTNINTLKLFSHARHEEHYARQALTEQTHKHQLATRLITEMDAAITALNGLLIVATAGLSLWLWSKNYISLGAITLTLGLVIRINYMSGWIMWVVNGILKNIGVLQDGINIISRSRKLNDDPQATPLTVTRGAIRFDVVSFHYNPDRELISGLTLNVEPGEK
jgi:ATP-binding cassette, subfamily B, multidrug efflux pump